MMPSRSKAKAAPALIAMPRDPNICFIVFPSTNLTAISAEVGLRSLCNQLDRENGDREIESIGYDPACRRLEIKFVSKGVRAHETPETPHQAAMDGDQSQRP